MPHSRTVLAFCFLPLPLLAQSTLADSARQLLNEGRFADAVTIYQAVISRDSGSVAAWRGLANALHRLERYPDALAALDRAAALSPNDFAISFNRGLTLSELGRMTEAVSELEASVRLRADFAPAWTELGAARALVGRVPEAREDWNRASAINPVYIWTRFYRGIASISDGQYGAAADDLDAVTAQEQLLSAHLWRWVAYRLDGRGAPNIEVRNDDWPAPIARYLRGELSDSGLIAAAERAKMPLDDRRKATAYFFIGVSHLSSGDRASARAAFGRALEQRAPRHAEVVAAAALLSRARE